MAKIPNLKLRETEVSQTFDLKELTGLNMSEFPEAKEAIGQAFIDKIVKRTESGKDVDGDSFDKYSKTYRDSLAFDAFGKTKDKVNLTQSREMLGTLDFRENKGDKIKIGWGDEINNAKAYNHNKGDTVPKRQFFGITSDELAELKKEFKPKLTKETNDDIILRRLDALAEKILK